MAKIDLKINMKALKKIEDKLTGAIDKGTLGQIGEAIKEEMLLDVSKGISPIKGIGRYDAYLAAGEINQLRKQAKQARSDSKRFTNYFSRGKLKATANRLNKSADKIQDTSNRYPYNQQGRKWKKKPRPVNLELSGEFLKALRVWITGSGSKAAVHVGFRSGTGKTPGTKADAPTKERGHREGTNGQPKRPMIPVGEETLTPKYALLIRQFLAQTLRIKLR